jgi:hypothetical protein
VFLDLAKEGATLRGILGCFAIAVSKGLQYGVPLEEYVDTFTFQTFEPRGMVEGHPNIKMANSIVDYVFRALGVEYLHRDELAQVPPDRSNSDLPEPPQGMAVDAGLQLDLTEASMEIDIDDQVKAAAFVDTETHSSNGHAAASPARTAHRTGTGHGPRQPPNRPGRPWRLPIRSPGSTRHRRCRPLRSRRSWRTRWATRRCATRAATSRSATARATAASTAANRRAAADVTLHGPSSRFFT